MPLWRRIQVTSLDSTRVVTNWRCSSPRCAVVTIAARGLPSGVRSIAPMSSGAPLIHAANDGEASSPFSRMANAVRSFGGKKESRSSTPSLRIGGVCTRPTRVARSRRAPAVPRVVDEVASRMCSRLDSGSASMHQVEQAPHVRVDLVADGLGVAEVGRHLERADDVQPDPAARARRVDRHRGRVAQRARSSAPPRPQLAESLGPALRPGRRRTRRPTCRPCASPGLTHGSKSAAERSGTSAPDWSGRPSGR